VCAADEVWRLQRGSEADCVLFQRMINGGERITDRGSRQGMWLCAPSGKLLANINTRNVERVLETLERGLAAWKALPAEARRLPDDVALEPEHRWEGSWPEHGLVLSRIARDLSAAGPGGDPEPRWNREHAWFSRGEIAALFPAEAWEGERELPLLARRLARFHLVDNARGQTLPYADAEVLEATLTARVVERSDRRLALRLAGATSAIAEGPWLLGENIWKPRNELPHGIELELAGEATLDRQTGRLTAFDLVAIGHRWGRTATNGRGRDSSPGLIGFHFALADPREPRIAPTFIAVYDADWVVAPDVPTWLNSPAECGLEVEDS